MTSQKCASLSERALRDVDEPDELEPEIEPGWLIVVGPEGGGERLDKLVARRVSRLSRARAARLEVIDLDAPAQPLKKSARVKVGQRLWVRRPPPVEDLSLLSEPEVLEQGEGLTVVNKPPGWAAHPTASRFEATITTWLKRRGEPGHPAHRLDVETSGVLLCATDRALELEAKARFKAHEVQKRYLAICEGLTRGEGRAPLSVGERWCVARPLGFDPHSAVRLKMGAGELASLTALEVLALDPHAGPQGRALLIASPKTGRQHQIRAHLALEGLPIVGDKLYGSDEQRFLRHLNDELSEEDLCALGHERQALHAFELSLELKGRLRRWRAPLPKDLLGLMSLSTTLLEALEAPQLFEPLSL